MSSGYLVISLLCFWLFWVVGLFYLMRFKDMSIKGRVSYGILTVALIISTGFFFIISGFIQKDVVLTQDEYREVLEKSFEDGLKEGAKLSSKTTTIETEKKVGEKIALASDVAIEITRLKDDVTKSGQVIVDFTIMNDSLHHQRFTGYDFSLYDGENSKARVLDDRFYSEIIAPGKKSSGQVVFQTENAGPYEVHFEKNVWKDTKK